MEAEELGILYETGVVQSLAECERDCDCGGLDCDCDCDCDCSDCSDCGGYEDCVNDFD